MNIWRKHLRVWFIGGLSIWAIEALSHCLLTWRTPFFSRIHKKFSFFHTLLLIYPPGETLKQLGVYLAAAIALGIVALLAGSIRGGVMGRAMSKSPPAYHTGFYTASYLWLIGLVVGRNVIRPAPFDPHYAAAALILLAMSILAGWAVYKDILRSEQAGSAGMHSIFWIISINAGLFLLIPFIQKLFHWQWQRGQWLYMFLCFMAWLLACLVMARLYDSIFGSYRLPESVRKAGLPAVIGVVAVFLGFSELYLRRVPVPWSIVPPFAWEKGVASKENAALESRWRKAVSTSKPSDKMPNVIIFVMDTVRADAMGAYNPEITGTPLFDRLARGGVLFDNAYSTAPWTLPGHGSLFSGVYSSVHGANNEKLRLSEKIPTLAQILGWAGYQTAAISGNGWINFNTGLARGFEYYVGVNNLLMKKKLDYQIEENKPRTFGQMAANWAVRGLPNYLGHKVGNKAQPKRSNELPEGWEVGLLKDWYPERDNRPYFLFMNFSEAHFPYNAGRNMIKSLPANIDVERLRNKFKGYLRYFAGSVNYDKSDLEDVRNLYDLSVSTVDSYISQVLDYLASRNALDNTLIIITADHGEYFGEYHHIRHAFGVHAPVIKIPMVFYFPGVLPAGTRIEQPAKIIDVMPTVLELAGVRFAENGMVMGKSLLPLIKGEKQDELIIAEMMEDNKELRLLKRVASPETLEKYSGRLYTLIDGNYQYVLSSKGEGVLYLMPPGQTAGKDVTAVEPERAARMRAILEKWILASDSLAGELSDGKALNIDDLPEDVKDNLKAMGYIQ